MEIQIQITNHKLDTKDFTSQHKKFLINFARK